MAAPLVGILMGSTSDWEVMKQAAKVLDDFGVAYEARAMSAHRTPDLVEKFVKAAPGRGMKCIIAGAGGAAHLAGVVAAHTTLPVLGVPMPSKHLNGLDSLLSTVQMPKGIPVGTVRDRRCGCGKRGAVCDRDPRPVGCEAGEEARCVPQEAVGRGKERGTAQGVNQEVKRAAEILRRGGLVAFPTETVYGLGADASSAKAIARLYAVKGRPGDHPVIVHFADAEKAFAWAREVPEAARKLAARFWPGPLTLILKRAPQVGDFGHRRAGHGRPARAWASAGARAA